MTTQPLALLEEQGVFLARKTRQLVTGELEQWSADDTYYSFYLVAPALNNYHYGLLWLSHTVESYPLTIHIESAIALEIAASGLIQCDAEGRYNGRTWEVMAERGLVITCNDESFFVAILQAIFRSQRSLQIINSLMAQSASI